MRTLVAIAVLAAIAMLASCGDNSPGAITIIAPAAWSAALDEFAALTPDSALTVSTVDDPAAVAATPDEAGAFRIAIADDPTMATEAYAITAVAGAPRTWVVHAHDVLGAQYGASEALENLGFRFRHPEDTLVPAVPAFDASAVLGVLHTPDVRVRGLQVHTLHPIESYFAFWEPSAGSTNDAHRVIDWLIKNRGNYLQWVALKDILIDLDRRAAWLPFTQELIAYAHMRGIRVGLGVELFGQSNLQLAFDLYDDTTGTISVHDQVAARLPIVTTDLPFDVYALSYGEFFDADPNVFISATNEVAAQLKTLAPAAEMHAVVHVGGTQLVTYMGQTMIYYFLVQFADPSIIPDIHTVMYYDMFEDTGGAYQMNNFDEHRQYLVNRMCAHQRAAYYPEDAYWVAFDDSVPLYVPLYVRSRWIDRAQLPSVAPAPCGKLDEHLLFSSGWEWGFWLHDDTSLRDSYEHAASPGALIAYQFAPDLGSDAAAIVADLADAQDHALITERLAPYLAGRDIAIDTGAIVNIVSQPARVTFAQLQTMSAADRAQFTPAVIEPLAVHADELDAFVARLAALDLPDTRWAHELRDGLAVDAARAHFVLAEYGATLAHLDGDDDQAATLLARAQAALADGAAIVARRDGDLHDTHGRRLVDTSTNQTYYQFGYLFMADTLCYWNRELTQVTDIVTSSSALPSSCLFNPGG